VRFHKEQPFLAPACYMPLFERQELLKVVHVSDLTGTLTQRMARGLAKVMCDFHRENNLSAARLAINAQLEKIHPITPLQGISGFRRTPKKPWRFFCPSF